MSDERTQETVFTGHKVVDDKGAKIGEVTDVIYDVYTQRPRWLVVDPGKFHRAHFMPSDGSYLAEDGRIISKYAKETVMNSLPSNRDHQMTPAQEHELEHYYA